MRATITIACVATIVLAACGDAPAPPTAVARLPAAKPSAAPEPPKTAAAPCPPQLTTTVAGPDVVGIRLGLTRDDALALVRCESPGGVLSERNQWVARLKTHGVKLGTQVFEWQTGDAEPCTWSPTRVGERERCGPGRLAWKHVDERITVATPGVPGAERVRGLWRSRYFRDGAMPTVQAAAQAVIDKYGAGPDRVDQPQQVLLYWLQDAGGRALTLAEAQRRGCAGIQAWSQGAQSWSEGCGLSVVAQIVAARSNPALAAEMHVGVVHQARLLKATEGLQGELDRSDQARRADELQQAAGTKVKL
jgi:hypothetical protein